MTTLHTVAATGALKLSWLLLAFPLFGAVVLLVGGRRTNRWGHLLGVAMPVAAFVYGVIAFFTLLGLGTSQRSQDAHLYSWIPVAGLQVNMNLLVDQLSICFVLLITGVGSLIIIYSVGYMSHDRDRRRFFGYMNLFLAAMLLLVLGDNYLVLYVGWEGVGLASYLLIGFWQYKNSAAVAAKKAFIVHRGVQYGGLGRERRGHGARAAAPARRVRQVRAGAAAVLAARRDGGADPGVGADPRRHHGHRWGVPARSVQPDPRAHARRTARGGPGRHGHAAVRRHHRLRQGRHQEVAGRVHHEPDRLHVPGGRPRAGRLRVRDRAPARARVLQGRPVPRRRLGHARHGRRGQHAAVRRAGPRHAHHLCDLRSRVPRHHRHPAVLRVLRQGPHHRRGLQRARHGGHGPRHPGADRRRHHRVLHDPDDVHDLVREAAVGARSAPARVAGGDDLADDRARDRLGGRRRISHRQPAAPEVPRPGGRRTARVSWLLHHAGYPRPR